MPFSLGGPNPPPFLVLSIRLWSFGQQAFVADTGDAHFLTKNHSTCEDVSIVLQDSLQKGAGFIFAKLLTHIHKSL
jgi:hypothetical protein